MNTESREALIKALLPTAFLLLVYIWIPVSRMNMELKTAKRLASKVQTDDQLKMNRMARGTELSGLDRKHKAISEDLDRLLMNHPHLLSNQESGPVDLSTDRVKMLTRVMTLSGLRVLTDGPSQVGRHDKPIFLKTYVKSDEVIELLGKAHVKSMIQKASLSDDGSQIDIEEMPQGLLWRVELAGSYEAMQRVMASLHEVPGLVPHTVEMTTPLNERIAEAKSQGRRRSGASVKNGLKEGETHWVLELWI